MRAARKAREAVVEVVDQVVGRLEADVQPQAGPAGVEARHGARALRVRSG